MSLFFPIYISISILTIGLGLLTYLHDKKKELNRHFLFITFSIVLWVIGIAGLFFINEIPKPQSLIIARLPFFAATLFCLFLFQFLQIFPKKIIFFPAYLNFLINLFCGFIAFVSLFTNLILKDILLNGGFPQAEFGSLIFLFEFLFIFLLISLVLIPIRIYKKLTKLEKLQVFYFFAGLILSIVLGILTNLIIPQFDPSLYSYKYGPLSMIFFVIFTTLAITRYRLFEIRVILTELLVGIIGLILLVLPFLMPTAFLRNLTTIIFILFCIFGYLLIKATHQEVKRREEIEKLSEELKISNVRLNATLKELERSYTKLKKLDEAKTQFFSIASHQLRTPLSVIKGYLSMALSGKYGNIDKEPKKFLENVYESDERLIRLVNDFLNISRFQMGVIKFVFNETPIEELVRSVVKELSATAKLKGLYLKVVVVEKGHSKGKKVFLKADSGKIRQVILNLVDNAIKYTEKGGITVKIQNPKSKIQILVEDTGIGIGKEEKEKLFKVFERGERATLISPGGVGIGLFIAKEIVKAHKGEIWAESEGLGKGSRFIVELPIE